MASPALSLQSSAVLVPVESSAYRYAGGDTCNHLLAHMLECDACLDPSEPGCPVYSALQAEIRQHGGASAGVVFAY